VAKRPPQEHQARRELSAVSQREVAPMNRRRIVGLLAAATLAGPTVASAQITTLDYQGYVMGGTSTLLPANYVGIVPSAPLHTASTTATFDAQVVFSGSVAANDLAIVSYQVDLAGNNGSTFEFANLGITPPMFEVPQAGGGLCDVESAAVSGCVQLTAAGSSVTGATFDLKTDYTKESNYQFVIGPNGDSFSYSHPMQNLRDCQFVSGGGENFVGSTTNPPCTVNLSNPTAGVWTIQSVSAPEIDVAGTASSLTLLLGSLAVMRGGRRTAVT
jgi:hypothetical protein